MMNIKNKEEQPLFAIYPEDVQTAVDNLIENDEDVQQHPELITPEVIETVKQRIREMDFTAMAEQIEQYILDELS